MPSPRPANLRSLLEDQGIRKVFHHAPFDLRFMMHHWQARPNNILCTKVASRLVNQDADHDQHSLKVLLATRLEINIEKSTRLSNWLAETLTAEQLAYAAGDVQHLIPLFGVLQSELSAKGLLELYEACCRFLPARAEIDMRQLADVFAY